MVETQSSLGSITASPLIADQGSSGVVRFSALLSLRCSYIRHWADV